MFAAIALTVAFLSTVIFAVSDFKLFGGMEFVLRVAGWAAIWFTAAAVAIIGFS